MWGQEGGLWCALCIPILFLYPLDIHWTSISSYGRNRRHGELLLERQLSIFHSIPVFFHLEDCMGEAHMGENKEAASENWRPAAADRPVLMNLSHPLERPYRVICSGDLSNSAFPNQKAPPKANSSHQEVRTCPLYLEPLFKKKAKLWRRVLEYMQRAFYLSSILLLQLEFLEQCVYKLQGRPKASKSLFKDSSLASSLQKESQCFALLFIFILHHSSALAQAFFLKGLLQSCCCQALAAVVEGVWCWKQAEAAALSRELRLWTEKTQIICWPSAGEFEVGGWGNQRARRKCPSHLIFLVTVLCSQRMWNHQWENG